MTTFAKLEQQKAETLELIDAWPPARLAYRPAPADWSATEVLDHIVRVESEITHAMRHGIQNPHRLGVRDQLRSWMIYWLFRTNRRVRVPRSASQVLPRPDASVLDIRQRWDATRDALRGLLTDITPDQRRGGVFRHPVSGWMSVSQVLRFFSVHIHHHRFQLARLHAAYESSHARADRPTAPSATSTP